MLQVDSRVTGSKILHPSLHLLPVYVGNPGGSVEPRNAEDADEHVHDGYGRDDHEQVHQSEAQILFSLDHHIQHLRDRVQERTLQEQAVHGARHVFEILLSNGCTHERSLESYGEDLVINTRS